MRRTLVFTIAVAATFIAAASDFALTAIGNSITLSQPDPNKGWHGSWGMAATTVRRDYAGQLSALLEARIGRTVDLMRVNHARLERSETYVAPETSVAERAQRSDMVVIELGDNALRGNDGAVEFGERYQRLLMEVTPHDGLLVCVGTWWKKGKLDAVIKSACEQRGGVFINLAGLVDQAHLRGSRDTGAHDAGVLSHPGDAGMGAIAAAAFAAVEDRLPARPGR